MVSKLTIPAAFDHRDTNCKMESRVEKLERILPEERKVDPTRLEEIQQLWKRRKGDNFRRRSRRDHAPSRRQRTPNGSGSVSELLDQALLLIEKNYAPLGGGRAVESEESRPELNSEPLMAQGSTNPATEIKWHKKGELKATREIPKERKFQVAHLVETKVEGDNGDVSDLSDMVSKNKSGVRSRSEDDRCVGGIGSDISKRDDGRYEGGGRGIWVETMISAGRVRPPEPPELPDQDVFVEKGGMLSNFLLPPPKPPDLGIDKEAGGSLSAIEGGLSPGGDELSPPPSTESPKPSDPWPCAVALGTIAAPEHKDMAAGSIVKKHKEGGTKMELKKLGHFLNLMGQAQMSLINWSYYKKGLRSSLKKQIGPMIKGTQITDEQNRLQEDRGMGLVVFGPNPISQIELETKEVVTSLTITSRYQVQSPIHSLDSLKLDEANLIGNWENSTVFSFVLSIIEDKASIVYDQTRVKFILMRKSTKTHIAIVIEVEWQNAKTFEETHFNRLGALNNIEAKKRFEFSEGISGYKLLYQVEPLNGEVLDYVPQSRGSYHEEQISLYIRMEAYERQVFKESWLSLIGPYGSPIGDSAHPSYKIANEGINVVMKSAANTHRNSITENGSGLLSQWLSSGKTTAAQDTEIVLDFFLFDPGGTCVEFEGGCATIVSSDPIIIDPTPLVAKLKVEVTAQSNFLKIKSSATNCQDNACGSLLIHEGCILPICDEILEIIVACCKHCGAETSSTKMGSKEWGFHLPGFKQWDPVGSPFKQLAGTYLSLHLEDKVNFEGAGIDADIRSMKEESGGPISGGK